MAEQILKAEEEVGGKIDKAGFDKDGNVKIRKKRTLLLRTAQCRQCNGPFSTTSSVRVVHDECRIAYYRKLARNSYHKRNVNRSSDTRGIDKCFVNDVACEACGYVEITKVKKFWEPDPENAEGKMVQHVLCFNCLMKYRYGLMEALTWKKLEIDSARVKRILKKNSPKDLNATLDPTPRISTPLTPA